MNFKIFKLPQPLKPNATLIFEAYTGETEIDPATNNETPVFGQVTLKAILTETGDLPNEEDLPGTNIYNRRVRGYLVTKKLPEGLKASDRVECVLDSAAGTEKGFLYFSEVMTPLKKDLIAQIGIPIQGTFQTLSGGT